MANVSQRLIRKPFNAIVYAAIIDTCFHKACMQGLIQSLILAFQVNYHKVTL